MRAHLSRSHPLSLRSMNTTQQTQPTRAISVDDVVEIMKDTIVQSAPTMTAVGEQLQQVGQEQGLTPVAVVGSTLSFLGRVSLQVMEFLKHDGITIVDTTRGTRGIQDTRLAVQVYQRIKEQVT